MNYQVVLVANSKWQDLQRMDTRVRNVALALARNPSVDDVIVVDHPQFVGWRKRGEYAQLRSWSPSIANFDLSIRARGSSRTPLADRLAFSTAAARIRKALPAPSGERVAIYATPFALPLIGKIGEDLAVFDAIDDLMHAHETLPARRRLKYSYGLIKKRDVAVTAVSEALANELDGLHVSNGVHMERFAERSTPHEAIDAIPFPRAVYVGSLQERVDYDLLREVATRCSEVSFVLIGPQLVDVAAAVGGIPNIHLPGPVPRSDVPRVLAGADVCILPHRVDEQTKRMDPMKLYEYLAAGKPVVSTSVAGTERFGNVISVADDPHTFATEVMKAITDQPDPADAAVRRAAVEDLTWERTALAILNAARPTQPLRAGKVQQ